MSGTLTLFLYINVSISEKGGVAVAAERSVRTQAMFGEDDFRESALESRQVSVVEWSRHFSANASRSYETLRKLSHARRVGEVL